MVKGRNDPCATLGPPKGAHLGLLDLHITAVASGCQALHASGDDDGG